MRKLKGMVFVLLLTILGGCSQPETATQADNWTAVWSQGMRGVAWLPRNDGGRTVDYQIPVEAKGEKVRMTFSNYYGEADLTLGAVSVSLSDKEFQPLTFSKKNKLIIPAGGDKQSDPLELPVKIGNTLHVRLYFAEGPLDERPVTGAYDIGKVERSILGDFTMKDSLTPESVTVDLFPEGHIGNTLNDIYPKDPRVLSTTLASVEILGNQKGTIVAFGDSITEQNTWVKPLAKKVGEETDHQYSVVNQGIGGNRLLRDISSSTNASQFFGFAGVDRFEHDVFKLNPSVSQVIVALGVNDIQQPGSGAIQPIEELPTFKEMVAGYTSLAKLAKEKGVTFYLATITPFLGYDNLNLKGDEKEALRQELNEWIRTTDIADGVYDFDQAVRDKDDPSRLAKEGDSGDHIHPNETGGQKMAELIDVTELLKESN